MPQRGRRCRQERGSTRPGPRLAIGKCQHASFGAQCETFSWSVDGTLRGELKATLLRFEDGKESILGSGKFGAEEMAVTGQVILLRRDGPPLGAPGERFVEFRLPVARDGVAPSGMSSTLATQALVVHKLPSSTLQSHSTSDGGEMTCLPNHYNVIQLWSETHAEKFDAIGNMIPWHLQRDSLLKNCVNGIVTTVLTIEVDLNSPSVPSTGR